jgi:16S rRNA (guanine966-N2)-methyltransferase
MNKKLGRSSGKATPKYGKSSKTPGFIRIIAGKWRGRKLPVHDIEGLRPTTDRVKETVFNWLMNDVNQAKSLDCFAGSGSLAIEALSRGAESVLMIEKDAQAARQIEQNLVLLQADNANVVKADSLNYLTTVNFGENDAKFDLVFIDPPFRKDLAEPICQLLETRQLLSPSALIYVEIESELSDFSVPASWQLMKEKTAGQVSFRLYEKT